MHVFSQYKQVWCHITRGSIIFPVWTGLIFLVFMLATSTSGHAQLTITQMEAAIARVFNEGDILAYEKAADLYLTMLRQAADLSSIDDQEVLTHQLGYLSLIMPADDMVRASLEALPKGNGSPQDVLDLVAWWHRQDPLPATLNNERLEEHLFRVYYARQHYADAKDSLGIDDRGRIFIRLGHPWRLSSIKLRSAGLRMQPYEGTLPRNEIWVYRRIHDDAHYLFIQLSRKRPYKLGSTEDLIPPNLRASRRKTTLLLTWLEEVLGQLALEHPHYGTAYDAVTTYMTLPTSDVRPPYFFAKYLMNDIRLRDDHHQVNRARTVPASATQTYGNARQLTPSIRSARFLEPSGITRLEIYWTLDTRQLAPRRRLVNQLRKDGHTPAKEYLLILSATTRGADFAPSSVSNRYYRLPATITGMLPIQMWENQMDMNPLNLAMQWQQYWTRTDSTGRYEPTATLGIGVATIDSIEALRSDGVALEMSDIRPIVLLGESSMDSAVPYAGEEITPATRLGFYFELYHLAYDDDGQTRYEVEYRIAGTEGMQPISTITSYTGSTRTAREQIMLDVSAWKQPGPITITLSAIDKS